MNPPVEVFRYGVKIARNNSDPNTRVEYILDAVGMAPASMNYSTGKFNYGSWENVWFVKDNYPCMLKYDGTVDYKLNPNNYAQKEDGTSNTDYNSLNYGGNAMASIPLCYLYLYEDTDYHYFIVSNVPYDENYKAYAHTNSDLDIVPEIFLSIYEGYVSSSKLRSISGYAPTGNNSMANEMTYAQANGSRWDLRSWGQRTLINVLLTIMSKSTDGQTTFGKGNSQNSSASYISTGRGNTLGQFWGNNNGTSSGANGSVVKTFHIENWWGNKYERLTGLLIGGNTGAGLKIKMYPSYNITGDGYTMILTDHSAYMSNYWLKNMTVNEYGIFKDNNENGSTSTYWCDYASWRYDYYSQSSLYAPFVGGASSATAGHCGPWYVDLYCQVSAWASNAYSGACLSFVPRLAG